MSQSISNSLSSQSTDSDYTSYESSEPLTPAESEYGLTTIVV